MTTKELIKLLNTFPSDVNVEVSIDMSKGEDDLDKRCFGEVYSAQNDGNFITILAECGEMNGSYRMTDKEKEKSIIPYQEKGYIFDEDLHEIYFHANGELMVKASVVEELKSQIEKMKNCENCKYAYDKKHDCMPCENMEDWELME